MTDKILTVNKDVLFKKLKDSKDKVAETVIEKSSEISEKVSERASSIRDKVQNQIVDSSLKLNEKQNDFIKKFRR